MCYCALMILNEIYLKFTIITGLWVIVVLCFIYLCIVLLCFFLHFTLKTAAPEVIDEKEKEFLEKRRVSLKDEFRMAKELL